MTRWHASYDLRLTAAGLAAATAAKSLRLEGRYEMGRVAGLELDTSG